MSRDASNAKGLRKTRLGRAWYGLLAVLGPPFAVLGVEVLFLSTVTRWLLFTVAIGISSWFGGLAAGIASTVLSVALVWWYLVPPERTLGTTDPRYYVTVVTFVAIGVGISVFHEWLRRARRGLTVALDDARGANEALTVALEQRNLFAALADNSLDFIGIADPGGTPVYVNPAGRRMVELPEDLPIETTRIPDYYASDARAFASDVIVREMLNRGKWAGETIFRNWRTEEAIPVWDTHFMIRDPATKQVIGMGTITRDMSEFKRTRDELAMANQRLLNAAKELEEAQRLAHIGSWTWDVHGDHSRWSAELYRIHGIDPTLPPPGPADIQHLFIPESAAALTTAIQQLLKDGLPFELELEAILSDGSHRWLTARGEAVRGPSGEIAQVRGTSQDITQLKMLERMKEEWTAVIAHDLRQPISVISMSAEVLPDLHVGEISKPEAVSLHHIRSAVRSLMRMVNDLLDVSRLEAHRLSLERVWVDPASIVRYTLDHLSYVVAGHGAIRTSIDPALPAVLVDRGRFEQILGNLISNAVKYGQKGGDILVRVERHDNEVTFAVINHGDGIPSEELPQLFTRFARSKTATTEGVPGLGLGLYIARGLVEAHGGRMWAESVPGETTTFYFSLPSRRDAQAAA